MSGEATRDDLVVTRRDSPGRDTGEVYRGACYGDYVVLERIGRGAMGQVFRALHPQLDRNVALKLIALPIGDVARRTAGLRVLREGRALARLRHPNVVTVHDVGEAESYAYVAMELVDGSTLRAWAATPRSSADTLATLVSAGRGLAAAHRAGLVHRDFKPDNVLVSRHGDVRVTDFGLARLVDDLSQDVDPKPAQAILATDATLSRSGTPIGTLAYMAPEVLDGAPATFASDQFSFCVTAFECLYGRRPFDGTTVDELRANIVAGQIWRVPASSRLRAHRLLLRGLSASPAERHPSVASLLDALEPVWRRRVPWIVALASFTAAAAAIATHRPAAIDPEPCADSARWDGQWDDARKADIHRAFAATNLPYAEQAYTQVRDTIDRYTRSWSDRQRERCVLATVNESPALHDELSCLQERRDDVDLLAAKLAHADATVVPLATRLSLGLRSPSLCQFDPDAVSHPSFGAASAELRRSLAMARLAHDAGDFATAERLGREVITGATGRDIVLATEARLLVGAIEVELHREGDDESTLFGVAVDAEGAGLYPLAAEGWLELAVATQDRPSGLAPRWIALADVAVRRAGNPPDLVSTLASRRASQAMRSGDFAAALALQQQASKLLAATYGANDLRVAASNYHLAASLGMVARCRDAEPLLRDVVAIRTKALSPEHPDTLDAEETLAICLTRLKRPAEALPILERTVHARERLLGSDSPALAGHLSNLAAALADLHRRDEALVMLQRAVALREAAYGPNDERVARPLINLGDVLVELGREAEAIPVLRRARDVFEAQRGASQLNGSYARLQVSDALSRLHRYNEALAELSPIDKLPPPQYAVIAGPMLLARGGLLVELGRSAEAVTAFEKTKSLPDSDHLTADVRSSIDAGLRRARAALARR